MVFIWKLKKIYLEKFYSVYKHSLNGSEITHIEGMQKDWHSLYTQVWLKKTIIKKSQKINLSKIKTTVIGDVNLMFHEDHNNTLKC